MPQRRPPKLRSTLAAAVLGAAGLAAPALARYDEQQTDPEAISGRDFGALRLPVETAPGRLTLRATRAWAWSDDDDDPPTRRVVLDGNVNATIGTYRFQATRAALWIQTLPEPGPQGGTVHQVFAVFARAETLAADAAIAISAVRLPVRAVIETTEPVRLAADIPVSGPPTRRDDVLRFTDDAQDIFRAALLEIAGLAPPPEPRPPRRPRWFPSDAARPPERPRDPEPPIEEPAVEPPIDEPPVEDPPVREPPPDEPPPPEPPTREPPVVAPDVPPPAPTPGIEPAPDTLAPTPSDPIFTSDGIFYIAPGDRVVVESGEDANTVSAVGGVVIAYQDRRANRSLELSAERAVIFLRPGPLQDQLSQFSADDVLGIYLEGGVQASDGQFTIRGPSVYYDVQNDRALMLDAVFWTYEQRLRMPLYVRAEAIRQHAADQFGAEKATVANTAFFRPDLAIGTSRVTITRRPDETGEEGERRTHVDARNITLRAAGVPVLWWPLYAGDPSDFPLKSLVFENTNRTGAAIRTTWNAFSLLGIEPPPGFGADLLLDYYFDRGPALGTTLGWSGPDAEGGLFAYLIVDDRGRDVLKSGATDDKDGETRGIITAQHRWQFSDHWTFFGEGTYISDVRLIPAFFRSESETAREFTNRAYFRRLEDNNALTIEIKARGHDFIANEWLLQAPGYSVDRLPEARFYSLTNDIFPETAPGMLTHSWEASAGILQLNFSEASARDYGMNNNARARRAFGTTPDESLADVFRAQGLDQSSVTRFDTRHELSAQLDAGPVRIRPFTVGRLTAYDDRFEDFSPDQRDQTRLWGGAGITFSTSLHRVHNDAESRAFDIHRIRHIVEPSLTLWHAGATVDRKDLPVFDPEVEALATGSMIRLGLDNTWQTKRGGPGRWRSVDLFRLNLEYVWTSADADRDTPIGRYDASRPELSVPGEFVHAEAVWQVSEVIALAGETVYDTEINQQARTSLGTLLQHTPDFSTILDLTYINSQNVTYGSFTSAYRLTEKYGVRGRVTYNFDLNDFQDINAIFQRRFPNGILGLTISYNNIRGETSIGFSFQPTGLPGGVGVGTARSTFGG